jgi:hypothetical protein
MLWSSLQRQTTCCPHHSWRQPQLASNSAYESAGGQCSPPGSLHHTCCDAASAQSAALTERVEPSQLGPPPPPRQPAQKLHSPRAHVHPRWGPDVLCSPNSGIVTHSGHAVTLAKSAPAVLGLAYKPVRPAYLPSFTQLLPTPSPTPPSDVKIHTSCKRPAHAQAHTRHAAQAGVAPRNGCKQLRAWGCAPPRPAPTAGCTRRGRSRA